MAKTIPLANSKTTVVVLPTKTKIKTKVVEAREVLTNSSVLMDLCGHLRAHARFRLRQIIPERAIQLKVLQVPPVAWLQLI